MRVVLLALALSACRTAPAPPPGAPDVLVVVLDTVRQDRTSTFGADRPTTPNLDALAAAGVRYPNTWSTSGWTSPAHASLFTGLYAVGHGCTQERWDLAEAHDTLAERLAAAGYETVGAVGNPMIGAARGFAQGFATYTESWRDRVRGEALPDDATATFVEQHLAGRRAERPLFLFVNLIGAHTPYSSCGASCGAFGEEAGRRSGIVDSDWRDVYRGRRALTEDQLARLRVLYDTEVLEVDRHLGRILAAFDAATGGDGIVLVTSDHGENIGDHGHVNHVFSLYESTTRVPLVARGLGGAPGSASERPTSLVDLFPTVLGAAGLDAPSQGLPLGEAPGPRGVLIEYYRPRQALDRTLRDATEAERARLAVYERRLKAWVEDGWKLHHGDDGLRELYHLAADPDEAVDLAAAEPARVAALEAALAEALAARRTDASPPAAAPEAVDPETRAALEALGYFE